VLLNPNALTPYTLAGDKASIAEDEALVREAASFLKDTVLPRVVREIRVHQGMYSEGMTLTELFHRHGVNMRYLGAVATQLGDAPYLQQLVIAEMVGRQAKHLFNSCLRESEDGVVARVMAHCLNCLFGEVSQPLSVKKHQDHASTRKGPPPAADTPGCEAVLPTLTTSTMWAWIRAQVKLAYEFELPSTARAERGGLPLLRSLCKAVGLQIVCRDYSLGDDRPFAPEDISDLFPVAKYTTPKCNDAKDMLYSGIMCHSQNLHDLASPLLQDALAIIYQVYGPMHQDTAKCYGTLALLHFQQHHIEEAISMQEKAVVILERVSGTDTQLTADAYTTLASLLQASGKVPAAAVAFTRALTLLELIHGPVSVGLSHIQRKASMLLQGHWDAHVAFLEKSLEAQTLIAGETDKECLSTQHSLALAYGRLGKHRLALEQEKKVYSLLRTAYGEENADTKRAKQFVNEFVKKALEEEKQQKKLLTQAGMSAAETNDIMRASQSLANGGPSEAQKAKKNKKKGSAEQVEGTAKELPAAQSVSVERDAPQEGDFTQVTKKKNKNKKSKSKSNS